GVSAGEVVALEQPPGVSWRMPGGDPTVAGGQRRANATSATGPRTAPAAAAATAAGSGASTNTAANAAAPSATPATTPAARTGTCPRRPVFRPASPFAPFRPAATWPYLN